MEHGLRVCARAFFLPTLFPLYAALLLHNGTKGGAKYTSGPDSITSSQQHSKMNSVTRIALGTLTGSIYGYLQQPRIESPVHHHDNLLELKHPSLAEALLSPVQKPEQVRTHTDRQTVGKGISSNTAESHCVSALGLQKCDFCITSRRGSTSFSCEESTSSSCSAPADSEIC